MSRTNKFDIDAIKSSGEKLECVERLAKMDNDHRRNIANETTVKLEQLILAADQSAYVRYGLLLNEGTEPEILQRLANDDNPAIRFGVLQHPRTSPSIAVTLAHDKTATISKLAQLMIEQRRPKKPEKRGRKGAKETAPPAAMGVKGSGVNEKAQNESTA